ncbi:hypothetical protein V6N13_125927 [Hibiscus sabdariffa]
MSNTEASLEGSFSPPLTDSQNSTAVGASSQVNKSKGTSVKRKAMAPRSEVWSHFTKFVTSKGESKGRCNYCDKEFCCDMKKNGTGSLKYHMMQCKKNPTDMVDTNQSQLVLPSKGSEGEVGHITNWKFDQETVRKALAKMIVIGELPFKFVESEGFRKFMSVACPRFRIPSRFTITRDVYQLYLDERIKLKQYLKSSCSKVCLTTDTWTSLQRVNYMCLTVHFIDNDWKLNKKIINFCPISNHKGEAIGMMIEKCLLGWGIDKLFTVTVDNASSNDVAINYLRKKFSLRGGCIANGKYLHMRCMSHIVNLIVVEGLKEVNKSVARVRGAVRYVRQSPARLKRQKLNYLEFALIEMYNAEKSSEVMQKLKDTLFELYDEYKPQVSSDRGQSSVEKHTPSSEPQQKVKRRMKDLYKRRVAENGDYIRNSSTEEEIKKIEELDKIDNDLSWNALESTLNS